MTDNYGRVVVTDGCSSLWETVRCLIFDSCRCQCKIAHISTKNLQCAPRYVDRHRATRRGALPLKRSASSRSTPRNERRGPRGQLRNGVSRNTLVFKAMCVCLPARNDNLTLSHRHQNLLGRRVTSGDVENGARIIRVPLKKGPSRGGAMSAFELAAHVLFCDKKVFRCTLSRGTRERHHT